jgi:glycosyltransferase involved in cell wall biosynthesis
MKIGLIARPDNGGLGSLSVDFYKNLPIEKVIALSPVRKEHEWKFPTAFFTDKLKDDLLADFCQGLDLVITFETPYNWNLFEIAKERKVKTVLIPNFEWMEMTFPLPDLMICPTMLDYRVLMEPKIYLPIPIDREILPFKLRTKAETFLFNAGRGGIDGRNQAVQVLKSIPLVKSDVKFLIRFQSFLRSTSPEAINEILTLEKDSRVLCWEGELQHYQQAYILGDVLVHPQKYGSLSLPVQEAMSRGMPIIAMNKYPESSFLPKDLLLDSLSVTRSLIRRPVENYNVSPEVIAAKIDEVANMDISQYSLLSDKLAEKWSWSNLKSVYLDIFERLINGQEIKQTDSDREQLYTL